MSWINGTKDAASWSNGTQHSSAFTNQTQAIELGALLMETGSYLLQESGFKILLEQLTAPVWSNQTQN